ncbi:hypothetical protein [Pseudomonas fluorescens]|uniref:hypothetical protein n=1 Tax=Pseudomonas fluorescens TaxID=294 RepID=UPI0016555041|nr:hypothetical protein [Pseudomonas fluorescens]MBC8786543.1 hypothetical protein [Pseudomonas fluorescens]
MSQFKPGDLALTLVDRCGVPAMSQVEVVQFVEPETTLTMIDGRKARFSYPTWRCSAAAIPDADLMFRVKELMPLRGDFTPEQQKAKEAV